jgi:hypothetical protein
MNLRLSIKCGDFIDWLGKPLIKKNPASESRVVFYAILLLRFFDGDTFWKVSADDSETVQFEM